MFDIGGGRFDHHAKNSPVRPNGVPYAAFGLLWRELGAGLIGPADARRFDESFVQPLDEDDNTGRGNQLATVIAAYNPRWDGDEKPDDCFAEAVALAVEILSHKFETIRSVQRAADEVNEALKNMKRRIVRLSRFAPWKQQLIPSKARFVVYPSPRGGWAAQAVPASFGSPALKTPLPRARPPWSKTAHELGIHGAMQRRHAVHRLEHQPGKARGRAFGRAGRKIHARPRAGAPCVRRAVRR